MQSSYIEVKQTSIMIKVQLARADCSDDAAQYCINTYKVPAKNRNRAEQVESGHLWRLCDTDSSSPSFFGANLWNSVEFEQLVCDLFGEAKALRAEQARILLALPIEQRYEFSLSDSFTVAERCRVGSVVLVRNPEFSEKQVPMPAIECTVRFKDILPQKFNKAGLYFGLVSCSPISNDGQPGLISVISPNDTKELLRVEYNEEKNHLILLVDARWLVPDEKWVINIGDRVVLELEAKREGPRRGTVKWLGRLDRHGPPGMVGVEFDHEIDDASYCYNDRKLFDGRPNCCRIVEESKLQAEEDFDRRLAGCGRANFYQQQQHQPQNAHHAAFDQRRGEAEALLHSRGIEIGSHVNVFMLDCQAIVMWFGFLPDENDLVVGVQVDQAVSCEGNGVVSADKVLAQYLDAPRDLLFTYLELIELHTPSSGRRHDDHSQGATGFRQFDNFDCVTIPGPTLPPIRGDDCRNLIGRNRGVQGHHNSCYLDSTLFAMFATNDAFDCVLQRPAKFKDLETYEDIKTCLREGVVNCLREHKFVSSSHVLKLRKYLNDLEVIPGMMSEEKDPEEFINLLLDHALRHEPFIKLSTGQSCHVLQLFLDRADLPFEEQRTQQQQSQQQRSTRQYVADTETLLHLSLIQSNILFSEAPTCLILQMPRSGKSYKMFHRILPVLQLNITNLLPNTARACAVCGFLATVECHQCFLKHDSGRDYTYCEQCFKTFTDHKQKTGQRSFQAHEPIRINYSMEILHQYESHPKKMVVSQTVMDLQAVVCIRTSHYVCFQRAHPDWLFFDSMADREGGFDNGYNIPEVTRVPDIEAWLGNKIGLNSSSGNPPEHVSRLLEDCYLCFYGNPREIETKTE